MAEIKRYPSIIENGQTPVAEGEVGQPVAKTTALDLADVTSDGLVKTIAERLNRAQKTREESQQAWRQQLSEASNVRMALAERLKPEDTTHEQRNLRRLAIGQSIGELLGATFGGIIGLRNGGGGYVPRMPGMAGKTLDRLTALKDRGVIADKQYQGLMSQLLSQDSADRLSLAKEDYREAQDNEARARDMQDNITQQGLLNTYRTASQDKDIAARKKLFDLKVAAEKEIAERDHKNKLSERQPKASSIPPSDEFIRTKNMLLPSTVKVNNRGLVEVVGKKSYNKQEVEYAESLAREVLPIRKEYNLSDRDIQRLQEAMVANTSTPYTWNYIKNALEERWSVDEIVGYINEHSKDYGK